MKVTVCGSDFIDSMLSHESDRVQVVDNVPAHARMAFGKFLENGHVSLSRKQHAHCPTRE